MTGAYGQAGRAIVEALLERGRPVIAAGRNLERLEMLAGEIGSDALETRILDIEDPRALGQACSEVALLINCVGPYLRNGAMVAEAALEVGIHCLDIAAEQEHYRRLQKLDERARSGRTTLATASGLYPGLSGLLLLHMHTQMPDAHSCEMSLFQGRAAEATGGAASFMGALLEMNYDMSILDEGRFTTVLPGAPRPITMPPPYGERELMLWPQVEILSLGERLGLREFKSFVKIGLNEIPSPFSIRLIRLLKPHKRPTLYKLLARSMKRRGTTGYKKALAAGLDSSALVRINLRNGERELIGEIQADAESGAAWLPARTAPRLLEAELYGLRRPDEFLDPGQVLEEIKSDVPAIRLSICES